MISKRHRSNVSQYEPMAASILGWCPNKATGASSLNEWTSSIGPRLVKLNYYPSLFRIIAHIFYHWAQIEIGAFDKGMQVVRGQPSEQLPICLVCKWSREWLWVIFVLLLLLRRLLHSVLRDVTTWESRPIRLPTRRYPRKSLMRSTKQRNRHLVQGCLTFGKTMPSCTTLLSIKNQ